MNIDLKAAVGKLFIDPKWVQKLLTGGLFYFAFQAINSIIGVFDYVSSKNQDFVNVPMLSLFSAIAFKLSILVIMLFLTAIPIGYVLQSVHNQVNRKEGFLPDWNNNMYLYFINGLKYYFIKFIYVTGFSLVVLVPFIVGLILVKSFSDNSFAVFSNIALFVVLGIVLLFVFMLLYPLIFIAYAENFRIMDAFNIKKFYSILSKQFSNFVMCYLWVIVIGVLQVIASIVLMCTCIGILFIPFLYLPVFLVIMNLFTEVYLESRNNQ
jgi:hypothetical protein